MENDEQTPQNSTPQPNTPAAPLNLADSGKVIQPISPDSTSPQLKPTEAPTTHLVGSQMQPKKKRLPLGVYIIAGFNLLGFIAGFFDSSQTNVLYLIAMFLNLLLAIGLMLRLEAARKFMVGLSVFILVLTTVSLFLLVGFEGRIQQQKADYEAAVSRIDHSRLTSTQKRSLEDLEAEISAQEKQAGKAVSFTYAKLGTTAVAMVAIIVYLTRPKVKEAFHVLKS